MSLSVVASGKRKVLDLIQRQSVRLLMRNNFQVSSSVFVKLELRVALKNSVARATTRSTATILNLNTMTTRLDMIGESLRPVATNIADFTMPFGSRRNGLLGCFPFAFCHAVG